MEIKLLYPTGSSITIRFRTLAARWKYYHSFHLAAYNHEDIHIRLWRAWENRQ